ncbi:MAG TPA: hypothetical protein PKE26_11880 [Kiritimatiellia bacterium]|nr:hypothetical protein [Kiritimatiellia bacterium]HMO99800.1 hypothetical protein [Kiritimatiellia bacterium]HMP97221.1 hypothetical protein [Kiritimatiellia bacterium]
MTYKYGTLHIGDFLADIGFPEAKFTLISAPSAPEQVTDNIVNQDRQGNFIAATNQQRNMRLNGRYSLKSDVPGGEALTLTLGGKSADTPIITSANARYVNNNYAQVDLEVHEHTGPNMINDQHLDDSAFEVVFPVLGYGIISCPVFTGSILPNIISMDFNAAVQHVDKQDRLGDHLFGFSFGCRVDATVTLLDNDDTLTLAAGWFKDSDLRAGESLDSATRVIKAHLFIAKN